ARGLGGRPARHEGQRPISAGALPGRRIEAPQHENDHVGVQDVLHGAQSRDSNLGCTRSPTRNVSESCSTPSKKISQGSLVSTRNPSPVRLRWTVSASTRNSFGSRIAWLRPVRNTLATAMTSLRDRVVSIIWYMPRTRRASAFCLRADAATLRAGGRAQGQGPLPRSEERRADQVAGRLGAGRRPGPIDLVAVPWPRDASQGRIA